MAVIKLSEAKVNFIKEVCKSYGNKPGEVINVLHKVQGEYGYLPAEVQELVAKELGIPVSRVYGIVSFYSFFTMTPKGEHPISVCLGTACYVRGGRAPDQRLLGYRLLRAWCREGAGRAEASAGHQRR